MCFFIFMLSAWIWSKIRISANFMLRSIFRCFLFSKMAWIEIGERMIDVAMQTSIRRFMKLIDESRNEFGCKSNDDTQFTYAIQNSVPNANFFAAKRISKILFISAKNGAKGKAATKIVTNPYCITISRYSLNRLWESHSISVRSLNHRGSNGCPRLRRRVKAMELQYL